MTQHWHYPFHRRLQPRDKAHKTVELRRDRVCFDNYKHSVTAFLYPTEMKNVCTDPDWLSKSPVNIFNKESTILRKKLEERIEAINRIKDVSLKELVSDKALSKMNSKRPRDEDTSPTMSEGGSAKAFQIAEQLRSQRAEEEDCAETPAEAELYVEKIVFSSRTHSQLAQFVEVRTRMNMSMLCVYVDMRLSLYTGVTKDSLL